MDARRLLVPHSQRIIPGPWVHRALQVLALAGLTQGDVVAQQGSPTFHRDIAPIVYENCSGCHRPGEAAPFSLLTYEDVAKRRRQILKVVEKRLMPPWLPAPGFGEFTGSRRLTNRQIKQIEQWVEADAPAGDPFDATPAPTWPQGWQLGKPDLVLDMQPFQLPAGGGDVFRNFVIPNPLDATQFVSGFELRTENSKAVHHAIVQLDSTDSSRKLDAGDDEPGFPGMTMGASEPPDGHFLGWTPGKAPRMNPPGMSWRLEPNSDLVVQIHMTPTGKPEIVRPRIGLHFTAKRPAFFPYSVVLYSEEIDIPAGEKGHVVSDSYVLPADVHVLGVYPHAHYLARTMVGRARLPDGINKWLFRIDDWDFNWQDEYRYVKPLKLPAGTQLSFEYHFDNSADNVRNPNDPPQRVTFGQRSSDEMATLSLQVLPVNPADRPKLEVGRWRHTLAKKPWDWHAHNQLAGLLLKYGDPVEALNHLKAALELKPDFVDALCNMGTALRTQGQLDEAIARYSEALQLDPEHAVTHQSLGMTLALHQEWDNAISHLRRAIDLRPAFAEAHIDLANVLALRGRGSEARVHYAAALKVRPGLPEVYNNIANTWLAERRFERAIPNYRQALLLRPNYFNAHLNIGRSLMSTGQKDDAVEHLRAARRLDPQNPEVIELLERLLGPRKNQDDGR